MFRQGLILAGLVGGMVMVGGSALAATPHTAFVPQTDEDPGRVLFVCGDENIFARGEVDNSTSGVLVLETGDILSQILGIKSKDTKCAIS
ncbi:hypothetical protein ACFFV7_06120 [Nonomuraea spiralis]|uniref:Uncharacterized protein n=1 Tax=Nonomuraea spiralis TaxID=46182 RepID=A0ABV5I897_9ACTN|nr:hypothetical protein [Nonomuraea spiralis]GGS74402.1 hypothetical protein GCM10010176_016630 [Nonomuraea spiralis]